MKAEFLSGRDIPHIVEEAHEIEGNFLDALATAAKKTKLGDSDFLNMVFNACSRTIVGVAAQILSKDEIDDFCDNTCKSMKINLKLRLDPKTRYDENSCQESDDELV